MQLKKLEMVGFKSFANKTEIVFEPGVTCVVGPNGCGKSNVVDAIKWVLGTQSYKSVRGEEMMDVIFKGADGVGPAGYSEVSLTLDNSDHALSLNFEEITITRRLHRDGVGEYFINRSSCRLKDIRDLLYGTGIGTDNYSIIEQGKIDRLVTSEPKQRRLVFDEAAGISKYRARKHETELRLDKVTQDLLRIGDTTREIQRQLRSVRSQASRAAAYRRLQEEYREKRARLSRRDFRRLTASLAETAAKIAELESRKAARDADLAIRREEAARVDAELAALDDRHAALSQELASFASKSEFLERTLEGLNGRREELARDRSAAEAQRDGALARLQSAREMITQAQRERAELETEAAAAAARLAGIQEKLAEADRECARLNGEIEAKKSERIELAAKETDYRNQRTQIENERQALADRTLRAAARIVDVERDIVCLREQISASSTHRTALEAEIADLKRRAELEEAELNTLKAEVAKLDVELVALRASKDIRASRQATLRELEASYEGLGEGTRKLLQAALPGVLGTLADLLDADAADVPALEAVLGDLAGMVVVNTREQARAALDFARAHGRATVVALEGAFRSIEDGLPAGIARGNTLARCEASVGLLLHALVGDVLVVEGPKQAVELIGNWQVRAPIVTRAGELYDPRGPMSAGARGGGPGILSRRAELKKLEAEIDEYITLITTRESRRGECLSLIQGGDLRLKELRQGSYEKRVAHGDVLRSLEQAEARLALLDVELETGRAEIRQLELQQAQALESGARVETLINGLADLKPRLEAEALSLTETQRTYQASRVALQEEMTGVQIERGTVDEKRRGVESRLRMLESDLTEQEENVRVGERRLADLEARQASVDVEISRHQADRESLGREIGERRKGIEALDAERQAAVDRSTEARRRISEIESEASAAQVEGSQLAVQQAQQQMSVQQLADRAREELSLDLATDAAPVEEGVDWDQLGREADDLRSRISNYGAVNVVALEELGELEKREQEIIAQHEDLEKTKGQLEELIRRINRESKELFERTLEFVREQFNAIFRKVFGGGKADIILQAEEGVDPLDQGLEVVARMPQREALPISMLSGGQKSLTAFSLVMALFKANPSPFCILDEADAALDETNVDKFAGVITEFVNDTQFIVISHNKRTMSVADVLYGVTMETPGVSKKVSVDLHGQNLDLLRGRREQLKGLRAESAARKAAAITEVKEAAAKAMEGEQGGTATAIEEPPEGQA